MTKLNWKGKAAGIVEDTGLGVEGDGNTARGRGPHFGLFTDGTKGSKTSTKNNIRSTWRAVT